MTFLISFFKKQYVFCISSLFAIISAFFVKPSLNYLSYFDWNTLSMLFCLMLTVAGLEKCGIFLRMARFLTSYVRNSRSLAFLLVFLSFFSSMFITNDVALLTFVPFAILLFSGEKSFPSWILLYVVVLQTLAANLGSMLTPVGNPQNIFLFSKMNLSPVDFILILLPYSLISALFLALSLFIIPRLNFNYKKDDDNEDYSQGQSPKKWHSFLYALMFLLCLLAVGGLFPKLILLPLFALSIFFIDRKLLFSIDYWLLLTFCAFFVFSGNISNIPAVSSFLSEALKGREFILPLLISQVISNVPATILLYPFASDLKSLLLGVNIGGLGTLLASLASLISFKLYTKKEGRALKYLAVFSLANILLLALFILLI